MLLPRLESFAVPSIAKAASTPKRFLALYVGHGFAITPNDEHPSSDLSWYPRVVDDKLKFGNSMAAMQPFADKGKVSVFRGLDHPQVMNINGHSSADSFLTGSNPEGTTGNPSIDQVAAMAQGKATRFPSLVLGNEGGLGATGSSLTLPTIAPDEPFLQTTTCSPSTTGSSTPIPPSSARRRLAMPATGPWLTGYWSRPRACSDALVQTITGRSVPTWKA